MKITQKVKTTYHMDQAEIVGLIVKHMNEEHGLKLKAEDVRIEITDSEYCSGGLGGLERDEPGKVDAYVEFEEEKAL